MTIALSDRQVRNGILTQERVADSILTVSDLHKRFGSQQVIDGLSFLVPRGSVFGFIGQNGSGKTTTMKMVLGLLRPDSGEITVCGQRVRFGQTSTNKHIGYLPDVPEFYNYMRTREYLRLCGEITGMSKAAIGKRSDELLTLVGLADVKKRIGGFSRGMKQRLRHCSGSAQSAGSTHLR